MTISAKIDVDVDIEDNSITFFTLPETFSGGERSLRLIELGHLVGKLRVPSSVSGDDVDVL